LTNILLTKQNVRTIIC